jgi:BirA family biotin operon repressor/biotin-[acetyl-CoA-carboxylase] ligase
LNGAVAAARRRLAQRPEPHPPGVLLPSALAGSATSPLPPPQPWRIQRLRQCNSTETELDRLLLAGASPPLVVLADRQSRGHGQQGRPWSSPPGGVWLSAALPWPEQAETPAALGLAVAVGMARELEALGLAVRIKWPNDLLIGDRKLAGLLPRLRLRGASIALARVGLGLNGWNRVPPGAIGLAEALAARPGNRLGAAGARWLADPLPLAARVLRALDWACARANQAELVRSEAQARLWLPAPAITHQGELWQAQGLGLDGSLVIGRAGQQSSLHRHF